MGRPRKDGLDYMSLDCDFYENKKMRLFRSEFGRDERLKMNMILVLICLRIYSGKGYYIKWDDEEELLCCDEYDVDLEDLRAVIKAALKRRFFDLKRFEEKEILTSAEITSRYAHAKDSRYSGGIDSEIGIVALPGKSAYSSEKHNVAFSSGEVPENGIVQGEMPIVQGTIPIDRWKSAQSKVKKTGGDRSADNSSLSADNDSSKTCSNGHRYFGDYCPECDKIAPPKAQEKEDEVAF